MEINNNLKQKYEMYQTAVNGFRKVMNIDISDIEEPLLDAVKNGRIQKFEYVTEFTWKILKKVLYYEDAIVSNSPKQAIKNFYKAGYIDENLYEMLFNMIEDRNLLSHIYDEDEFEKIHDKLNDYLLTVDKLIKVISNIIKVNSP